MIIKRKTIKDKLVFEGRGLHSGEPVKLTFRPGQSGIAFTYGSERVAATIENVTDTSRCTRLGSISTIEHAMATFACLEITDIEVEVSGPELPGLDGSALPYVQGLMKTGLTTFGEREIPALFKRVWEAEGEAKIGVANGEGHWKYSFFTENRYPGEQTFESKNITADYPSQIAPARTFVLSEEMPMVLEYGLGKGLDPTTVVMVGPDGYDNTVRFADELARHKLLDLIGDLYLAGLPVASLNVVAERSGHRLNIAAAHKLRAVAGLG